MTVIFSRCLNCGLDLLAPDGSTIPHTCHRSPNEPEPPPKPGIATPTWELVMRDMAERDRTGEAKYGVRHQHDNGRDHLVDAYQENLDQGLYLRAEIESRKRQRLVARQVVHMVGAMRDDTRPPMTAEQFALLDDLLAEMSKW